MLREVNEVTFSLKNLSADKALKNGLPVTKRFRHADVGARSGANRWHDASERVDNDPIANSLQNSWRNQ
jgi:hypothetical protein